jgi:hypothetical protein
LVWKLGEEKLQGDLTERSDNGKDFAGCQSFEETRHVLEVIAQKKL